MGNKGYNDNLVDVGRWFQLNDYFIASPSHTSYPYNIRELDSMEITNSDKAKGLFKEIDTKISKEKR